MSTQHHGTACRQDNASRRLQRLVHGPLGSVQLGSRALISDADLTRQYAKEGRDILDTSIISRNASSGEEHARHAGAKGKTQAQQTGACSR